MRFLTFTSLSLLGGLGLASCVDEVPLAPQSPGASSVSSVAAGGVSSYVIIGAANALPKNLGEAVQAAGGTLTDTLSQIGVAFASSDDAGFSARAATIAGVSSVVQDMVVQWVDPNESAILLDADAIDVEADATDADVDATDGVGGASIGSNETYFNVQWALKAVHAPEAWDVGARGTGVRVAVIDGGLNNTHIDLNGSVDVARSASFVPGFAFNQDVYCRPVPPATTCTTFSHATHVAGIIAARDNSVGTIGIAPGATIIGVKVLHGGAGSFAAVIKGIVYAATPIAEGGAGVDIINLSLGGTFPREGRDSAQLGVAMGKATTYAYQQGVTVFVAAGNAKLDFDHTANVIDIPAQSPHVLAISALAPKGFALGATNFDDPASYTNFGQSLIAFGAPGGDARFLPITTFCSMPRIPSGFHVAPCVVFDFIVSPGTLAPMNNSYAYATGTSMAAPAAAAVGALIIEKYGRIGPAQVAAKLRASADDLGKPGNDDFYGLGRVNAFRAVQ
jgi:subtilisin family serine protease